MLKLLVAHRIPFKELTSAKLADAITYSLSDRAKLAASEVGASIRSAVRFASSYKALSLSDTDHPFLIGRCSEFRRIFPCPSTPAAHEVSEGSLFGKLRAHLKVVRCDIFPSRVAIWWSDKYALRLSALAAEVLIQGGKIKKDSLETWRKWNSTILSPRVS
jgi:hypothetical protein